MTLTASTVVAAPNTKQADGTAEAPAHRKLRQAAQEFEGILIGQLMSDFKLGSSSLGGDTPMAGSDTMNSLAIQSLSSALARRGGLGIAQMLVRKLEPRLASSR